MADYKKLPERYRRWLEMICEDDPYGLSPQTLFRNIRNSTGDLDELAKIFEVPWQLVEAIKKMKD